MKKLTCLVVASFLLSVLMFTYIAHGEYDAQTYNLTRLFEIQSIDRVLLFGSDRVCAVSYESYREGNSRLWTATFVDIAQKRVLGKAQFETSGHYVDLRASGDNVCFAFEHYREDTDTLSLEKVEITPDGALQTYIIDWWERQVFPMPGGGWIMTDDDGNLYLRTEETAEPRVLLSGNPYYPGDEDDPAYSEDAELENILDSMGYSYYQALDDYRFIYHRWEFGRSGSCGVYDLRTESNLLLNGSGRPERIHEDTLLTNTSVIDLRTFTVKPLPEAIRNVLAGLEWNIPTDNAYDFSPEMRTLCELDDPWGADSRLNIYDVKNGERMEIISLEAGNDWSLAGCPTEGAVVLYGTSHENRDIDLQIISFK